MFASGSRARVSVEKWCSCDRYSKYYLVAIGRVGGEERATTHPLAELGGEIIEDEVGVALRDRCAVGNVVAHNTVGESEVCGRSKGKVTDNEAIGLATVLVHDDDVRHTLAPARLDDGPDHVVTSVHPLAVGEDQLEFLCKLLQAGAGVACSGDEYLWVLHSSPRVFVVQV